MERLPKDVLLIICDYLLALDYFKFRRTSKRIYERIKEKEKDKILKLLTENERYAAKYMVFSNNLTLISRDDAPSLLIDYLFYYSIWSNKRETLKYFIRNKYPAPHDILYTALKARQFDMADCIFFRKGNITDLEMDWLLREKDKELEEWFDIKQHFGLKTYVPPKPEAIKIPQNRRKKAIKK